MSLTKVSSDRKSTRLNSSHLVISYAVFCLKKNKTEMSVECLPASRASELIGKNGRVAGRRCLVTPTKQCATHLSLCPGRSYFFFFLINRAPPQITIFPLPDLLRN